MIKSQLFISLLLVISLQTAFTRFLAVAPSFSAPQATAKSTTYSSTLQCGECILANYTFCVKGAEGMITNTAPTTYCCKDTASCDYARNSSWNCSSKYSNTVEQLKVCPFYTSQCGSSSSLILNGTGDTSCLKINSLQAGNACLYQVSSKCAVPNFYLNDTTNVVIQYKMISNSTVFYNLSSSLTCTNTSQTQACICQNITISGSWKWNCSCTNPSNNVSVSGIIQNSTNCSINTTQTSTSKSGYCCVSSDIQKTQLQPVCATNNQKANCTCVNTTNTATKQSYFNCSCKSYSNNYSYSYISVNSTSCYCDPSTSANKVCNCCASNDYFTIASVSCSSTTSKSSCNCTNVTSGNTSYWKCNCSSNSVQNMNLSSASCSCNSTSTTNKSCLCCVTPTLTCASGSTNQSCACKNVTNATSKTWYYDCNCTRADTMVTKNFTYSNTSLCLNNSGSFQCCVTTAQQATQVKVLSCPTNSTIETCTCTNMTNATSKTWYYSCSCNRTDTKILGSFNFTNTSLCLNQTGTIQCCVTSAQYATQIPTLSCATNYTGESCTCANKTNATSKSWYYDCNCTRPDNNITKNFNFSNTSLCLNYSNSISCCVSSAQYATQLKTIACAANSTNQSCACSNKTNSTSKTWYYDCNCTRTDNNVVKNFTFSNTSACINNTNAFQCCVTTAQQATQLLTASCDATSASQSCSCVNKTNSTSKTWYYDCNCTRSATGVTKEFNFTNTSMCVNNTNAFNCCVSAVQQATQVKTITCATSYTAQSCSCSNKTNATTKQWYWDCNCTRADTGITLNFTFSNQTNCYNSSGYVSCCLNATQVATQINTTLQCATGTYNQNCSCKNMTNAATKTWYWDCNCSRLDTGVSKEFNITNTTACKNNSGAFNCCISATQYATQVQIMCPVNNTQEKCACKNVTNTTSKTWYWDCNCTRTDNSVTKNFLFTNTSNCANNSGTFYCCINATQYAAQINTISCTTNTTNQACACSNKTNTTSKSWYWDCNCTRADTGAIKNFTYSNTSNCVNNSGSFNCCVTAAQYATQYKTVSCAANTTQEFCSCTNKTNTTSKTWYWDSCSCNRTDTNVTKTFNYTNQTNCLNSSGIISCCVSADQYATQIKIVSCAANASAQMCSCSNKTNTTSKQWYWDCNCTRTDTAVTMNFTYSNQTNCYNSSGSISCCVTSAQQATQVKTVNCSANYTAQPCSCVNKTNTTSKTWYWDCNCTRAATSTTKEFNFTNTSLCYNSSNYFSCCLTSVQVATQIKVISCANTSQAQSCACSNKTNTTSKTWYWDCNCTRTDTMVTSNFTFANQSNCFNSSGSISCCLTSTQVATQVKTVSCSNTTSAQSCSCSNKTNTTSKTWYWDCNCTRAETGVTKNFTFSNQSNCYNSSGYVSCCLTSAQALTQIKVINCSATSYAEMCSCSNKTNTTSKTWYWDCNCSRTDTAVTSNFTFSNQSNCYNSSGSVSCCLNSTQYATQVQKVSCQANLTEGCSCSNKTNTTSKTWYWDCNCTRTDTNVTKNFTFNNSLCLISGGYTSCCLTSAQYATQIKVVSCVANSTAQSCACSNKTNTTTKTWYWDCNCTNSGNNAVQNFTFTNQTNCYNSSGSITCCVTQAQAATQIPALTCAVNASTQTCACANKTNATSKTWYWDCNCTRAETNVTKNFTYSNTSSCTNYTTYFKCCVTTTQQATQIKTISCGVNTTNQACACSNKTNATSKTWYWDCNCTRSDTGVTKNFTYSNTSNCVNNTGSFNCCVTAAQVATQVTPFTCAANQDTYSNCSCKNVTNTTSKTWSYQCNCTYKNGTATATKTNVNFTNSSCSCTNNSGALNCTCCYTLYTVDSSTCDAANKAHLTFNSTAMNSTNCKYEYSYYVAVVATGKSSSVLLQLQSYQLAGNYLTTAFASVLLVFAYLLY